MSDAWRQDFSHPRYWIPENTTARYPLSGNYQLTDEAGVALTQGQISTMSLTIYDLDAEPPTPIPGTWPRDVKTANGGSLSATGGYVLVVPTTDNVLLDSTRPYERRRWALLYTYAAGAKTKVIEVDRVIAKRTT